MATNLSNPFSMYGAKADRASQRREFLKAMTAAGLTTLAGGAPRSLRAADVVVVPSEFTRDRVRAHGLPAGTPVVVVPWSARPAVAADAHALPERMRDHRLVLYPAITYPHKNHQVLLDAFAALAALDDDVRLVLPGGEGSEEARVRARIERPDLHGRVIRLGRVPTAELEAWYAAASLVVVPSRYEGFGLPALEAQVRGVPVLAARSGSLPEVVAARDVVDPDDVTGWTSAMRAVLEESPTEQSARVADGRRRAASWHPERTAAGLLEAYRMAAAPAGGAPA
jgi:alpha-1,3-rhamnosyl/mannosyltransferase